MSCLVPMAVSLYSKQKYHVIFQKIDVEPHKSEKPDSYCKVLGYNIVFLKKMDKLQLTKQEVLFQLRKPCAEIMNYNKRDFVKDLDFPMILSCGYLLALVKSLLREHIQFNWIFNNISELRLSARNRVMFSTNGGFSLLKTEMSCYFSKDRSRTPQVWKARFLL